MPADAPLSLPPSDADLASTPAFDHADPAVAAFAREAAGDARDDVERAARVFAAVRDRIRYHPYSFSTDPADYTAARTLAEPQNWCVPKAILLTAAARAVGVPARIGFADVRNHLTSERLTAAMGTDLFVFHGYTALFVDGAWRKASPAFNRELCERFGVEALAFDGRSDALLHAYDGAGRRHMEYVTDHGTYSAVPFDEMFGAWERTYDMDRMRAAGRAGDAPPAADPAFDSG